MREINSVEEMRAFGATVATKLSAGDLLLLSGSLGSGKTAFTQGLGEKLGFKGITSPTFVISKIYKGKPNLIHVDAIFDDLDLESFLPSSITVVEWGEGLVDRIADKYLELRFEHGVNENQRLVEVIDHGSGISI
jgi:tRNA threonylcarbamoyladenosine biosynthesis protein TsaE